MTSVTPTRIHSVACLVTSGALLVALALALHLIAPLCLCLLSSLAGKNTKPKEQGRESSSRTRSD